MSIGLRFTSIFWLAAIAGPFSYGQTACPGVKFRTESSVNLAPDGASHIRLARQSDGSYTGYEVADAAPYGTGSVIPDFQNRLTSCSLTNSSYQFAQDRYAQGLTHALETQFVGNMLSRMRLAITGKS